MKHRKRSFEKEERRENRHKHHDRHRKKSVSRSRSHSKSASPPTAKKPNPEPPQQKNAMLPARAGGIYIPPFKMKKVLEELKESDKNSVAHQKYMWEMLRKSINGIINKVNVSNIQHIVLELFNENVIRGKGLLARAIMKAQMASPNFTHVYAALVSVINTKLPEVVRLLISRVILQFQQAFQRNNKIVCISATKMLAHMVNQAVVHEVLALQMLALFLDEPTEDSVEVACEFMIECGQVLSDCTP